MAIDGAKCILAAAFGDVLAQEGEVFPDGNVVGFRLQDGCSQGDVAVAWEFAVGGVASGAVSGDHHRSVGVACITALNTSCKY